MEVSLRYMFHVVAPPHAARVCILEQLAHGRAFAIEILHAGHLKLSVANIMQQPNPDTTDFIWWALGKAPRDQPAGTLMTDEYSKQPLHQPPSMPADNAGLRISTG